MNCTQYAHKYLPRAYVNRRVIVHMEGVMYVE